MKAQNQTTSPAPLSAIPAAPSRVSRPQPIEFPTAAEEAEAKAEMQRMIAEMKEARQQCPSVEEVNAALRHMRTTERGNAVLRDFAHFLNRSALGLDLAHWSALVVLVRAGKGGIGPEVRDAILERGEVCA